MKILFVALGFTIILASSVRADVTSQTLRPALNSYYQTIEDAQLWLGTDKELEQSLVFVTLFNTVDSPIIGRDTFSGDKVDIVRRTSSLQLGGSWLIAPKLQVGADFGLHVVSMANGESYFGVGDFHLMAKQSLLQKENDWGLSLAPDIYIPVDNSHAFISNNQFGYGGRLFFEKNLNSFAVALNAGYLRTPGATYSVVDYSTQYPLGIGLRIPMGAKIGLNFEGTSNLLPDKTVVNSPGDFYVGTQISIFKSGILSIGGSYGKVNIDDSASIRVLVGLNVLPFVKEPIKTITREKQVYTLKDCNPKPYLSKFKARTITEEEGKKIGALPFTTKSGEFRTVHLGHQTGTKEGVPYVQNSQVIFAIDISTLPKRHEVISVDAVTMKMKVNKLVRPEDPRSGMLCLIQEKICSGDFPTASNPRKYINSTFFEGKEPPNDFFMRGVRDGKKSNGMTSADLMLPLQKFLENSIASDPSEIIYDRAGEPKKALYFAAAHDIYISRDVELEVSLSIATCTTSNSETMTEPPTIEIKEDGP